MSGWMIELPTMKPLSANDREHWAPRSKRKKAWREAAAWSVRAARVPAMESVVAGLVVIPPDRRRRDPANLMPTQKACIDGMVDAGVVPDDSPGFVSERVPVLTDPHPKSKGWKFYLRIEVDGGE